MALQKSSKERIDASYALWLQLQQGDTAPGPIEAQEMIDRYGNAYLDVICDLLIENFIRDRRPHIYPAILEAVRFLVPEYEVGED